MDDPGALAAAINRVLSSPAATQAMVTNAHDDYMADYSEGVVVAKYLEFFNQVAG
jgi:glycosyltransferase involved in cell wall biosynthesis